MFNDAVVGARAADLPAQMVQAGRQRADIVTVLIGANDACADSVDQMTPVRAFRASIDSALRVLVRARPTAQVLLSSIPDLGRLWRVGRVNATARLIWDYADICSSMLANPLSAAPTDNQRRTLVQQRVVSYNEQLAAACRAVAGCHWDGGAAGRYRFTLSELSPFDFFHPNRPASRHSPGWSGRRT